MKISKQFKLMISEYKIVVSSGLLIGALIGKSVVLYRNNPYIFQDMKNYNGQVIDNNLKDSVLDAYKTYCNAFPNFQDVFEKRISTAKIYNTSHDKYVKDKLYAGIFYQHHNQILVPNKEEIPHELGHLLSYDNKTKYSGFETEEGYGKGLNEGFEMIIYVELFLDNYDSAYFPSTGINSVIDDINGLDSLIINFDAYHTTMGVNKIIADIVESDNMTNIYFDGSKNVNDIKTLVEEKTGSQEMNNLIPKLDDLTFKTRSYIIEYYKYKDNPTDEIKKKLIADSKILKNQAIEVDEYLLAIINQYLDNVINEKETEDLYADLLYYDDILTIMNSMYNIDSKAIKGYNKFINSIDLLRNKLKEKYGNELPIKQYAYKALIDPTKTKYKTDNLTYDDYYSNIENAKHKQY